MNGIGLIKKRRSVRKFIDESLQLIFGCSRSSFDASKVHYEKF